MEGIYFREVLQLPGKAKERKARHMLGRENVAHLLQYAFELLAVAKAVGVRPTRRASCIPEGCNSGCLNLRLTESYSEARRDADVSQTALPR